MPLTREDTKRAVSVLQRILEDLEMKVHRTNAPLDASGQQDLSEHAQKNLQHMINVQGMLDNLQSPLFISLQDIQTRQREALENPAPPEASNPRPVSMALPLAEEPELLPQFCQRYGISQDMLDGSSLSHSSSTSSTSSLKQARRKSSSKKSSPFNLGSRQRSQGTLSGSGRVLLLKDTQEDSLKSETGKSLLTTSFINAPPTATPPSSASSASSQPKSKSKKDKWKKDLSKKIQNEATVFANDGVSSDSPASLGTDGTKEKVRNPQVIEESIGTAEEVLVIANDGAVGTNRGENSQPRTREGNEGEKAIADDDDYETINEPSKVQPRSDNSDLSETNPEVSESRVVGDGASIDQHESEKKVFVASMVRAALEEAARNPGKEQSSAIETTPVQEQQSLIAEPAAFSSRDDSSKFEQGGMGTRNASGSGTMGNENTENGRFDLTEVGTVDPPRSDEASGNQHKVKETAEDEEEQTGKFGRQSEERNAMEEAEKDKVAKGQLYQPQRDGTSTTTANRQQAAESLNDMENSGELEYAADSPIEGRIDAPQSPIEGRIDAPQQVIVKECFAEPEYDEHPNPEYSPELDERHFTDSSQHVNVKECFVEPESNEHHNPEYSPELDEKPQKLEHFLDEEQSDEDFHEPQHYPEPDYSPAREQGESVEYDTECYPDQDWRDSYHSRECDSEIMQDYPEQDYHNSDREYERYMENEAFHEESAPLSESNPELGVSSFRSPLNSDSKPGDSETSRSDSQPESPSHATPSHVRGNSGKMMAVEDWEELQQDYHHDDHSDSDTGERMRWKSSSESLEFPDGEVTRDSGDEVTKDGMEKEGRGPRMGGAWREEERNDGGGRAEEEEGSKSKVDAPRDLLFFMRDRKSLSELSQALNRHSTKEPRSVTLTTARGSVGGASKVGLRLCGFSSTGVFVEEVVPGSEAETSEKIHKGDQLLEIEGKKIENMAHFEVDLILREIEIGKEVNLFVLYNPTGFTECARRKNKESR